MSGTESRESFERLLGELRPKLHRYCARMTGSTVDGEDVVQEALIKAIEALPSSGPLGHPEAWLFRIAHNAALDFLRHRARRDAARSDEDPAMIVDPASVTEDRQAAAASLRTFMRLPVAQRSSVILMDVLGYSLQEIGDVMESSLPAVKAALHRGRTRLRDLAQEPDDQKLPALAARERSLLLAYVDRFNVRDFDAIRDMLADEVRLDVISRVQRNGRHEVGSYFIRYGELTDWILAPGLVEGRPAALVRDAEDPAAPPVYFILLDWTGDRLLTIRDFRFARYVMEGADIAVLD
jgi:RNA polymerase sigma-70 factor (ECF subfamily)